VTSNSDKLPGPPFLGDHPHDLDPFVEHFGSTEAAYDALVAEIVEALKCGHVAPGKYQLSVRIHGVGITARGWISETGEVNVATAFVFRNAPGGAERRSVNGAAP